MSEDNSEKEINICAAIEAILFAAGGSVERERIAQALEISAEEVDSGVEALLNDYESTETGITIIKLKNSYQIV